MAEYIDKDAVVAEIEKLIDEIYAGRPFDSLSSEQQTALWYVKSIMSSINTLAMKEVDLEKEINEWQGCEAFPEGVGITPLPKAMEIVERTAKHFFELGMTASNKAQKGEEV